MDKLELQTLRDELQDDYHVALDALGKAKARFARKDEVGYEACAHHLSRMYNAIEQGALRVAKAFENSIDDEKGWHTALLTRLSIAIQGVRPALFPKELLNPLKELRAFRHVFVHAYELEFDPQKLALLLMYAEKVAQGLERATQEFVDAVSKQHQIGL